MAFFKSKPNLPDAERARIEFHLQQIAECIGSERLQRPVVELQTLLEPTVSGDDPTKIIKFVGQHLGHDVSELRWDFVSQPLEKCGGGG